MKELSFQKEKGRLKDKETGEYKIGEGVT